MFDYSKKLKKFHDEHVTLTAPQRKDMKARRNRNRERIENGLEELEKPQPVEWINQGGYAQRTMTQPPEGDEDSRYDIDMGVVFEAEDSKTPETTKGWVRDAIAKKAANLKNEPEAKLKCVRVVYANGYQCDFPVFRRTQIGDSYSYQLAAGRTWIDSDPASMNSWIEEEVSDRSPEDGGGPYQLRRVIRYVKYFAKVHAYRQNRKFPGGLVTTALAIECYVPVEGRDDEAVYETLKRLSHRSEHQLVFANGIAVSDQKDVDRIKRLIDAAAKAVEALNPLTEGEDDLAEQDARKAWRKVFRHSFFDEPKESVAAKSSGQNAARAAGALAAPTILASTIGGLSAEEKLRRAESAVNDIRESGRSAKPWSGSRTR